MKKSIPFYLTLPFVAAVTLALLAVPLIAMRFTDEVRWSMGDFIVMGALLFGTGTVLAVALRSSMHIAYRAGMVIAIGGSFLMIWVNLAVGIIGSGPNLANLLYAGVIAVLLIGVYLSKFSSQGLQHTMFATAFAVIVIGAVAFLTGLHKQDGGSVKEIVGVSLFFAAPYIVAGLLFRFVAFQRSLI